jgi:hypothetical protein
VAHFIKLLQILGLFLVVPFGASVLLLLAPFVLVYFLLNRVCLTVEYIADLKHPIRKKNTKDKRSSGLGDFLNLYNGIQNNKKGGFKPNNSPLPN